MGSSLAAAVYARQKTEEPWKNLRFCSLIGSAAERPRAIPPRARKAQSFDEVEVGPDAGDRRQEGAVAESAEASNRLVRRRDRPQVPVDHPFGAGHRVDGDEHEMVLILSWPDSVDPTAVRSPSVRKPSGVA